MDEKTPLRRGFLWLLAVSPRQIESGVRLNFLSEDMNTRRQTRKFTLTPIIPLLPST